MYPTKVVRLWPRGSKKYRHFTIVLCYQTNRHRGSVIERLGHFNPHRTERVFHLNGPRLAHWLNRGAKIHRSLYSILSRRVLYEAF